MSNLEFIAGVEKPEAAFIILKNEYAAVLQLAVNHLLTLGYELRGDLMHTGREFVQVMLNPRKIAAEPPKGCGILRSEG